MIFTPHLACFKRGILATITAKLIPNISTNEIKKVLRDAYEDAPCVRVLSEGKMANLQSVQHTGYCDIGWAVQGEYIILTAAIDNLLKGAASQAVQCVNIRFGFDEMCAIL